LRYASLFVTAVTGTGSLVPPAHASARAVVPIYSAPASGLGLLPMAFAFGGPTRTALLAPYETSVSDAWLPDTPEASLAPEAEPAIAIEESAAPHEVELPLRAHCTPNPFATTTSVVFDLPHEARVALTVHDVSGREVRHLAEGTEFAAGSHLVRWDGRDDFGREVESGTYTIRLRFER
jgi:hypothetical protein